MKSAVHIFIKDLTIVQEQAKQCNVDTRLSKAALSLFQHGKDMLSLGKADDSSVVRVYQDLSLSDSEAGVYDEPRKE